MEARSESQAAREVLAAVAHDVTTLVGDGCLVRLRDGSGELAAVAADHREAERRELLRALFDQPPLRRPGGWVGQALERACVIRIPQVSPDTLVGAGLAADERIGDAIVVPAPRAQAAIVAVRDRLAGPYSAPERLELERITAEGDLAYPAVAQGEDERSESAERGLPEVERIVDVSPAALWMLDARGRTTWVNEAASELVCWPARELAGVPAAEFIRGARGISGADLHVEETYDRRLTRGDGEMIWVQTTARALFERGMRVGTLLTLVDVDERKREEVDLRMRLETQEALAGLAERSLKGVEIEEVLTASVELLVEQLDIELATVGAVDVGRGELEILASAALPPLEPRPDWAGGSCALPEPSAILAALREGEVIRVADYECEPTFARSGDGIAAGIRSAAFAPIAGGTAVISAAATEPDAVRSKDLALLESVAEVVSARYSTSAVATG